MTDESEISKAARDAFTYGTGFMRDGKHVPMEDVYMSAKDAATDDLVKRLRAEDPECGLRHSLAMEAADEIERLRVWLESGGGRYWEGRYRDEAAMVDKLQAAIIEWGDTIADWEGIDFADRITNQDTRKLIEDILEKKDASA
jgi:hypothetical protein